MLFTDTNSLVYKIEADDIYEDIYKNKYLFGFSNYPEDSTFFDPVNKKVIGKMKLKERIQIKLHRIGTYDICKISLSCFDDKRYILDDGINSLAYFCKNVKCQ